jgi:imidazolonepropionase-like amidohydrolase
MLQQYNEFNQGLNIVPKIGQTYFVDGKRMMLSEIKNNRYIFIKNGDVVNVPKDKLYKYVSEKKKHVRNFQL